MGHRSISMWGRILTVAGISLSVGACAHFQGGSDSMRSGEAAPVRPAPVFVSSRAAESVVIRSPESQGIEPIVVAGVELENTDFDIPVRVTSQVEHWVDYFTGRGRELFGRYLERSEYFIPYLRSILEENQMPKDLVYLAMIESGFNNHARSRAKAVGPWQFMAATGKQYGLRVDWWVDERRDVQKSTLSAIHYLSDLYRIFGSWELAWAAYNAGESKVSRAIRRFGTLEFWSIARHGFLRPETRNYVPKLMAAAIVSKNRTQFGFPPSKRVYVKDGDASASDGGIVRFEDVGGGGVASDSEGTMDDPASAQLEPLPNFLTEYEDEYHENGVNAAVLVTRLPAGVPAGAEEGDSDDGSLADAGSTISEEEETAIRFAANRYRAGWDGPPRAPAFAREIPTPHLGKHGEVGGETLLEFEVRSPADLLKVARASGLSYETVKSLNPELRQWCTPPDGMNYKVKLPEFVKDRFLLTYNHPAFPREVQFKKYKVRAGDSIPAIARRFRVDQDAIKRLNGLGPRGLLRAGNTIDLPLPADGRPKVGLLENAIPAPASKKKSMRIVSY